MLRFLYALNFSFVRKKKSGNNNLWKLKYLFLRKVANIFVIFYYKLPYNKKGINKADNGDRKYIVSLTSYPGRINVVWIAIESLLRQSFKPDMIILWLAKEQFNGLDDIPKEVIKQQKRGLTIRFCDDLRSHKKYYYAFKEFSEEVIITVDDDVIYPSNTLEVLVDLHKKYPNCICSNRAHVITKDKDNQIEPYKEWVNNPTGFQGPSKMLCPTGVSGVLYPPNSVDREIFNKVSIKSLCFYADDLWLKIMSFKKGTSVVKSASFSDDLFTIETSQKESLGSINVMGNRNDEQLQAILKRYDMSM